VRMRREKDACSDDNNEAQSKSPRLYKRNKTKEREGGDEDTTPFIFCGVQSNVVAARGVLCACVCVGGSYNNAAV
jgi:hypothetical protein